MRSVPQPVSVGLPEKPKPGSDGRTRWNASSAVPPCAVGSVSGPTVLEQLLNGPRPAMRHDQRQGVGMPRANVDEVDVDAVDSGLELRQRVQPGFSLSPVVAAAPVLDQRLQLG